ncbi:secondary thiamine-phosphate synthase enzyme YjbQ [Desulfothermus okinawensis JCM 13304]
MNLYFSDFSIRMERGIDIKDITQILKDTVSKSNIKDGVLHVTSIGSTGSITTIEYEPGVVEDLKRAINEIAPPDRFYEHEKTWHDGNGHSHVQAAIIGPSISLSIRNGKLILGTWQQVVLINHDIHPRDRKITVTILGSN